MKRARPSDDLRRVDGVITAVASNDHIFVSDAALCDPDMRVPRTVGARVSVLVRDASPDARDAPNPRVARLVSAAPPAPAARSYTPKALWAVACKAHGTSALDPRKLKGSMVPGALVNAECKSLLACCALFRDPAWARRYLSHGNDAVGAPDAVWHAMPFLKSETRSSPAAYPRICAAFGAPQRADAIMEAARMVFDGLAHPNAEGYADAVLASGAAVTTRVATDMQNAVADVANAMLAARFCGACCTALPPPTAALLVAGGSAPHQIVAVTDRGGVPRGPPAALAHLFCALHPTEQALLDAFDALGAAATGGALKPPLQGVKTRGVLVHADGGPHSVAAWAAELKRAAGDAAVIPHADRMGSADLLRELSRPEVGAASRVFLVGSATGPGPCARSGGGAPWLVAWRAATDATCARSGRRRPLPHAVRVGVHTLTQCALLWGNGPALIAPAPAVPTPTVRVHECPTTDAVLARVEAEWALLPAEETKVVLAPNNAHDALFAAVLRSETQHKRHGAAQVAAGDVVGVSGRNGAHVIEHVFDVRANRTVRWPVSARSPNHTVRFRGDGPGAAPTPLHTVDVWNARVCEPRHFVWNVVDHLFVAACEPAAPPMFWTLAAAMFPYAKRTITVVSTAPPATCLARPTVLMPRPVRSATACWLGAQLRGECEGSDRA